MKSVIFASMLLVACGPSTRDDGPCNPGATRDCYDGQAATENVGPCHGGTQQCLGTGEWGACSNEVVPSGEICGDNIDNNCNGMVDEDIDQDGDGFTTCGGDCCDSTECSNPTEVGPGAIEVAGDGVDNDCDGMVDNVVAPMCDSGLASSSSDPKDYAKAMDICQEASVGDKKWGLLSATLTLADGTGSPDPVSRSIRTKFGSGTMPQMGSSMVVISSGTAAAKGDTNPDWQEPGKGNDQGYQGNKSSGFPADFVAANGNSLPNAPGCPKPIFNTANDPVMLTMTLRVPSNAHSFKLRSNFYSAEFPEFTCTQYNDFFVILLDSTFAGMPGNPADKNLAVYTAPDGSVTPVGVNLGFGNTGLFTQCVGGKTGCEGLKQGMINTCTGTGNLTGTGFDDIDSGECDAQSMVGGATGWLTTTGNVVPGEVIKLRIAIWDTSDHRLDSLALIDGFEWSAEGADPGTVIERR